MISYCDIFGINDPKEQSFISIQEDADRREAKISGTLNKLYKPESIYLSDLHHNVFVASNMYRTVWDKIYKKRMRRRQNTM